MRPPAPTSWLSGGGPCPTHFASSAERGRVVRGDEVLLVWDELVVVVGAALRPPAEQAANRSTATIRLTAPVPVVVGRIVTGVGRLADGFLDLAGLDARRADVHALGRAVHDRPDPLDVRVPASLRADV